MIIGGELEVYLFVFGLCSIEEVGEGRTESTGGVEQPVVAVLFHQNRNEFDALGHFGKVGRDGRYGRTHRLVIHILCWTCSSSKKMGNDSAIE